MEYELELCDSEEFEINGGTWFITLPKVCRLIIDTPIFQRLRRIKQNGITDLVYPDATHSRFVHSLATASLAYDFMNVLQRKYPKCVTKTDILCVTIAALVHDLGHGPFSHLFEEIFKSGFCHEEISGKLFMKIINDYTAVRKGLLQLKDAEFALIQQLINPPSFENIDIEWPLLVPRHKAFLFAIVSNPLNGLDVDKLEYLMRDSSHSGVRICFDKEMVSRLINSVKICKHKDYNISWVSFYGTHGEDVHSVFSSRKRLYQVVYNHRFILIASEMMKKALRLAAPYLLFKGSNGKMIPLNQCSNDLDAYIKLDDSIYSFIRYSPLPEMEEAQKLLEQLEMRQIPKIIAKLDEIPLGKCSKTLKSQIEKILKNESFASFESNDIYTITKSFNGGKGDCDPLPYVLFYPRTDSSQTCTFNGDSVKSKHCIFVYASNKTSEEDAKKIFQLLMEFSKEAGIGEPKNMFKIQL
uniref:HD domain-containing protein n=1 Tax=Panagrolaimus sp. ES5 TaxID=591445 RepID=A0AC34FTA5_9BILA